ncbi:sulfite exporter TauE/SafE family protein [Streptomyces sp. MBT56]|uniref:nickel/cobalt transporter n=1 Tax=unclassified Streptomyces TaxID=2593676 RepID=UPI00190CADEE|nr:MULTISPECIES: sulfite exporter TauE/SafE family protein [unclassified Streptomyces]MBK3557586.1 sulfite exporter TauE/SafE family protein [Streptomyces sp. MBT56]MBK3606241.1 sulfite exporter TauE/SafE family protein [Streptomyces sp. MBT54]MBK3615090.1 sulfite exporter TauE/SafE family protein [Streptomyces sp. MBT98]
MNSTLRRALTTVAAGALAAVASVTSAPAASAHPLGNFSVNYHTGLVLRPDRIDARVVVDHAEISALQERPAIDTDHDGRVSDDESRIHAEKICSDLSGQLHLSVGGTQAEWRRSAATLVYENGEAGLKTSRLTCSLTSPADLTEPAGIRAETDYDTQRVGWHEMTATGHGVRIARTDVPATSTTRELRQYPADPLASPLDQRSATVRSEPGQGRAAVPAVVADLPGAGVIGGVLAKVTGVFDSLVGAREITLPVGLLALFLAVVLGASHAAMPGHGKTIMAAYLAGRRGTRRDALTVGATVTLTHTAGVLVLGLALPVSTHLAGETVLMWLGAASGLLVTGIGLWLLTGAVRGRPQHNHHHHGPGHGHSHSHHGHHGHHHDHDHRAERPHDHRPVTPATARDSAPAGELQATPGVATLAPPDHDHHPARTSTAPRDARGTSRTGLIGMGIAGGLVPSPSALVVLLGAVALGRTAFGVLLVIGYGLGMAATLTLAGLLLVRLRERIERRARARTLRSNPLLRRLARTGPVITSILVIAVGLGLTLRAAAGDG